MIDALIAVDHHFHLVAAVILIEEFDEIISDVGMIECL